MKSVISLITLLALLAVPVSARETLGVFPDSAAGIGMTGGRFANLEDPSTLKSNPANILRIGEPTSQLNFGAWHGDISFTAPNGARVTMDDPWKLLASLYFVDPINPGKTAWGIGINTPYGLDSKWPKDGYFKYIVPYESTLLTLDLMPAFAFKASESVSIGIGLDIMYSQLTLKQQFPWALLTGAASRDGELKFDGDGFGIGGFAGITWEPAKGHRLSLTGRLPVTVNYDGDFNATNVPGAARAAGVTERSDFSSEITYPGSIGAGYGVDITERLTIGFDVSWSANSSHKEIPLSVGRDQALLGRTAVPLNWKNSWEGGFGMQYKLNDNWVLRTGYTFSQNSQPNQTYNPSVATGEHHLMSLGFGWHNKNNALDLSYAYAAFPDRDVTNNIQPAFNGHYEIGWHVISLSYSHKF